MEILLLCTGNICRSPMAEGLLRHELQSRGVPAQVHSAGTMLDGEPASAHGVHLLAQRGIDLSAHRSRVVDRGLLASADLVLGMARQHVRHAVVADAEIWPRAFTLKELVRRGAAVGPRSPDQPFAGWVAACHEGRRHTDLLGEADADDVADPIGQSRDVYAATAAELHDLITRFCDLAFPARVAAERDAVHGH